MARFSLSLAFVLFIVGCGLKPQPQSSTSAHLLLKTPIIRMADFAFIKQHSHYTHLLILSSGRVVLDMRLGEDVCLNGPCYKRSQFNQRFFGRTHYPTLLDDIIEAKPIYNGKGRIQTDDGFTQSIQKDKSQIKYQVSNSTVRFEDKDQNIKIVIKFQKE